MNPLLLLLLLFVGIPLVELYFLIEVGSQIGALPTILLTVFTAVLGGALVRLQGFSTAMRVRAGMDRGEVPAIEMLEGVVLLLSGILLLLPGFFTDLFGFLCLVPPVRRAMIVWFLKRSGTMRPVGDADSTQRNENPRVIEGEFHRDDD
ncbi:FxsA family protein [Sedimenticola thiotaurini]|uniref:Exlusion protein FxsA n=1 Tax=Sedimenticola thiotaurini TaxID=1543721 RepID=A0A0F7K299_9GAMM|nr:FxsA family protein [Sedimenticola thiotaurini]AKH21330.1 exlusion protein FxsA [Sedimenticola thiotaurini]